MDSHPDELKVIVRGQSETATRINLNAGKFNLIIDEPTSVGGTNLGPSPIQVILMSLAGCINVTGYVIAKQKGLQLNGLQLTIEGVMNPAAFYGTSFEERAGFKQITVSVQADFVGASKKEIEDWLAETEKRCPVTDNIKAETPISIINILDT